MTKISSHLSKILKQSVHTLDDYSTSLISIFRKADLSIFHKFAPPPAGGGHQFLRAIWHAAEENGLIVENNSISPTTRACLFNSFNFDENRLSHLKRNKVIYVHRVDGPIDTYRGQNTGIDQHIWKISEKFADKTIFQSNYSLQKHIELGLKFRQPEIILNAVDPSIFHQTGRLQFSTNRKIRLIAASWSDNPRKGSDVYAWMDKFLDWDSFEFTFVGRSPVKFKNIKVVSPVPSSTLSDFLRDSDIYLTASQNDPCSNSLIEALSCGCPALFLNSGGHPEIVKNAGLGFTSAEEIPELLSKLIANFSIYQSSINIPTLKTVADKYFSVMELK